MSVKLIAKTEPSEAMQEHGVWSGEDLMVYCARVSNPSNQLNVETGDKLLRYCIVNKHWSVFEQASMTVEIKTSRAIAQQILRHRSFSFQEFSQRYAVATEIEDVELRKQGTKNRQGGEEIIERHGVGTALHDIVETALASAKRSYEKLIELGVAKECARFVLPLATSTTIYMTGSVRSWIHYLDQRLDGHAQKEHRFGVATAVEAIFKTEFPKTYKAWVESKLLDGAGA